MASIQVLLSDEIEDRDWHECVVIEGSGMLRCASTIAAYGEPRFNVTDILLVKRIEGLPGWFAAKKDDEIGFIQVKEVIFFPEI